MARVLIIDDDRQICRMLISLAERSGHDCVAAYTLRDGINRARVDGFDLVFLDINLPDGCGLDMISDFHGTATQPEIIIITGQGSRDGAEVAIRSGVWDYIEKGMSAKDMILSLEQALAYRQEKLINKKPVALNLDDVVGGSKLMKKCYDLVARAAGSTINVLIAAETGAGKEVFARAIHQNSSRAAGNFVVVDCAALPSSMVESVLFGHEKGAYTGADHGRDGLVAQAEGGTLFLDEVGELPLEMQKVFLRVLQEHRYRPLGGKVEQQSDFRLIAATNRDLEQMVREGNFRQDLLFRLKTLEISLPPLRERPEDISELARFHLNRIAARYGSNKCLSAEIITTLERYPWPGNVRELVNAMEVAYVQASQHATMFSRHLPLNIRIAKARDSVTEKIPAGQTDTDMLTVAEPLPTLQEFRRYMDELYFKKLMLQTNGDLKKAIDISGSSRSSVYALQQKYGKSFS